MIAQKSKMAKKETLERKWYVVDAEGKVLGRLATRVARLIMGKGKPDWTPHVDCGDHVVVSTRRRSRSPAASSSGEGLPAPHRLPGGLKEITLEQAAREEAGEGHPRRGPRHDPEGAARPPDGHEAQGLRGRRAPARGPETPGDLAGACSEAKESTRAMESTQIYSTGRRKTAVARVWLKPGSGAITVNSQEVAAYFPRKTLLAIIQQPLEAANALGRFDVVATVEGGGLSGPGRRRAPRHLPRARRRARRPRRTRCAAAATSPATRARRSARSTARRAPARASSSASAKRAAFSRRGERPTASSPVFFFGHGAPGSRGGRCRR